MQTNPSPLTESQAGSYAGPSFRRVEQISWDEFSRRGEGLSKRAHPLLIKDAIRHWPATQRWTFEQLAALRRRDGSEVLTRFQIGIAEQGESRQDVIQPIAPYLLSLARAQRDAFAAGDDQRGLLSAHQRAGLSPTDVFRLDWSYMKTLPRDQPYISLWHILKEFPQLKDDFRIAEIWPGLRWDWAYTFLGPGKSVTGFHYDYPNNLFCQVSGAKEFLLFPPDQNAYMAPSSKYDWGGKMSHVDITRLDEQPERAAMFAQASGLYARVESGDALFVPRRTWHAVVSSIPSVSLAVFGLTPRELVVDGVPSGVRAALHAVGLYGRGNCTCHGKAAPDTQLAAPEAR
ncbi:cupin-like domain-containing protein [uncultured Nevskia sp.]|uniref:cupin-like domain-containing protein n=1 Tax=uncultured Nevskia sp. TaxID=228950 RepID=UPI0025DE815A|nr:cupin-like domain-containing protein [uncultured Nevskia sp.]